MKPLEEQVVLVTGASRGIERGITLADAEVQEP
jgi:NAD(P)-dependent dehydrogenase (short-subunit alcohol dehydrogenase family)